MMDEASVIAHEGEDAMTSSTISNAANGEAEPEAEPVPDLSGIPPTFVFPTRLTIDELHETEDMLLERHAPLTYDATEAGLFIGRVGTKRRAELELRTRGVWTEEVVDDDAQGGVDGAENVDEPSPRKKRRIAWDGGAGGEEGEGGGGGRGEGGLARLGASPKKMQMEEESETEVEVESGAEGDKDTVVPSQEAGSQGSQGSALMTPTHDHMNSQLREGQANVTDTDTEPDRIKVLNLQWLQKSVQEKRLLNLDDYLVYKARRVANIDITATVQKQDSGYGQLDGTNGDVGTAVPPVPSDIARGIMERARMDAETEGKSYQEERTFTHGPRKLSRRGPGPGNQSGSRFVPPKVKLLQQITSDHEDSSSREVPEPPDWVKEQRLYACERSTLLDSPNGAFADELKKIRLARILTEDEIGVRAYSTSIASVAAYPYKITSPREIIALPGCDVKIANLWIEWKNNDGVIQAVKDAEDDETLKTLRLFYDIWGVGATTAREFYNQGWRDLDDIIEYGWSTLTRVQQIGVKFYDEFKKPIPRFEVEAIARTIHQAAVRVRDAGIEICIVGGYRRGKSASGDVDVIVSHRRLEATANLITDIVAELEASGHVTHTLLLSLAETERGQATLPYRSGNAAGHGFDSLDKALLVWQDPIDNIGDDGFSGRVSEVKGGRGKTHTEKKVEQDGAHYNHTRASASTSTSMSTPSSRPHRRVDIIISPWRTVGCAVLGWSGGTTFQRDLRRYARKAKGWKFDSSGIRDRASGMVMDLEGEDGVGEGLGMEDAEKKVFEGLGLKYKEPWERCTG